MKVISIVVNVLPCGPFLTACHNYLSFYKVIIAELGNEFKFDTVIMLANFFHLDTEMANA